jgi:ribosomal protein S3AE
MKLRLGNIISIGIINKFHQVTITFDFEELNVKIECSTIDGRIRCNYNDGLDIRMTFYSIRDNNLTLNLERVIAEPGYEEEFVNWLQEIINDNIIEILALLKNIHKSSIESYENRLRYKKDSYDKFNWVFYKELMLI